MSDDKRIEIRIEQQTLYSLTKTACTIINIIRRTIIWAGLLGAGVALVWAPAPAPTFGLIGVCICAAWACVVIVGYLWG